MYTKAKKVIADTTFELIGRIGKNFALNTTLVVRNASPPIMPWFAYSMPEVMELAINVQLLRYLERHHLH